ncbi:MAG: hypothetical protein KDA44_03440 [Planctomycetales bacterium]|nr:hypothetical protein [Planctomycetales bacterium]
MTFRRRSVASILVAGMVLASPAARAQKLEQIRQSVHTAPPSDPPSETPSKKPRRSDSSYANDDPLSELAGMVVWSVVAAPYYLPYHIFDDPFCNRFGSYCQQRDEIHWKDTEWFYNSTSYVASARAQVDYGTNFDGIQLVGSKLQVDLPILRTTLDASVNNYFEELPGGGHDQLTLGDANLVWRFAQSDRTVWRSGLGVNWLADSHNDIGFNFTYGFDALVIEPLAFSTEIDLGTLGHSNLFRSRTTLGAQWRDWEVYTGFEYLHLRSADLSNMLLGVRYWW